MSDIGAITVPAAQTAGNGGGFRQLLELNLGRRVTAEFLVGLDETAVKTGTLYAVTNDYFILNDDYGNYVAADLYSLKFLTFCPACVPVDSSGDAQPAEQPIQQAAPQSVTDAEHSDKTGETTAATPANPTARLSTPASMAALNYAKRKARRLD